VGNKKQAGAAFPSLECEEIRQLWNWTRSECPAYQRFISTGEELNEDQTLDGFDEHAADGDEEDEDRADRPLVRADLADRSPDSLMPMDADEELAHDDGSQAALDEVAASAAGVDEPRSLQPQPQPQPQPPLPPSPNRTNLFGQQARSGIDPGPPTSKDTALRVSVGSVISVAWSPTLLALGTVVEVTQNAEGTEIKAKVNWDDGDETVASSCIILFGEQAVRFTIQEKPSELAVRLGRKNLMGLFRGPNSSKVFRTGDIQPLGSFALTMGKDYHSTASDGNKLANGERFATALADFPNFMIVSAAAADHNSHERTLQRVLDLVGNLNSTTGMLTDLSVCLGLAFKVNKDKSVDGADAVILGTPIAMMTEGGYGNKSLELTLAKTLAAAQRRYGPNDFKDPVMSTKMLSVDSNLVMRRIDSIDKLTSIVGGKLVEQIKTILISWRMLDGLRDCNLFQTRDRTMDNFLALSSPSAWARMVPQSAPNSLGAAILVQCAQSMALTLVSENRRAARTETVHTAAQREARFFTACGDIVQVLEKNASLFGCTEEMDVASKESIKKRLLSLKPLLPSKTERRPSR
jgi:hypothetical protein